MARFSCYAVKVGRVPGIYDEWSGCFEQTGGYPGAIFRGFRSRDEAERWLITPGSDRGPGRPSASTRLVRPQVISNGPSSSTVLLSPSHAQVQAENRAHPYARGDSTPTPPPVSRSVARTPSPGVACSLANELVARAPRAVTDEVRNMVVSFLEESKVCAAGAGVGDLRREIETRSRRPVPWVLETSSIHFLREGRGGVGVLLCCGSEEKAYSCSVSIGPCVAREVDWVAAIHGMRTASEFDSFCPEPCNIGYDPRLCSCTCCKAEGTPVTICTCIMHYAP